MASTKPWNSCSGVGACGKYRDSAAGTAGANRLAISSRRESAPAAWMLIQDLAIAGRRLLSH
jgi:hypothetical protein